MTMEKAQLFFEDFLHKTADEFFALPQSGSSRKNYVGRSSDKKYIITFNENLAENESFFYFSNIFSELNLNTPQIFKISDDRTLYVQEYLGGNTLSEIIEKEGLSDRTELLVKQVLENLYELQNKTENKIDWSKSFEYEAYDEFPITSDLFYFKSFMVDVLEIPYHKGNLLKEFKTLTQILEHLEPKGLMIRDFQARNIMVNENDEVFSIDYQSAMNGPLMYDVVSFLFQAKANFPRGFKDDMLEYYYSLWKDEVKISQLKSSVKPIQLIRFMQVLGAYGFRGLIQRKPHFVSSIDQGIENLYNFSESWEEMKHFPELKRVTKELKSDVMKTKINSLIINH